MNHPVIELAKQLIGRESITPDDAGCQAILIERLQALGFSIERIHYQDTTNLWARRGTQAPLFCFAGHTDVVPPGKLENWHTPPFTPTVIDNHLHGRGAADMKGSIAAFMLALERFIQQHPEHNGSIALLITSDEEGPFINGTVRVIEHLQNRGEQIDWCIVGEPSSSHVVGDVIKNGRRGSLTGVLNIHGVQGHVAYPHLADNPIHKTAPALAELSSKHWDKGNAYFPPTSFQIVNINAGTGASNVVPGELQVQFNFRFSTEQTSQGLVQKVESLLDSYGLDYALDWTFNGEPFLTDSGPLLAATQQAVEQHCGFTPEMQTTGGTSDGRFIAPMGAEVLELGPCNATIHKVNEAVCCDDLIKLADIYQDILGRLLA